MTDLRSGFGELRAAGRFLRGLRPFLRGRVDPPEARRRLERRLAEREQTFARVLRVAVFDNPASPYRKLLDWAGIASGDVLAIGIGHIQQPLMPSISGSDLAPNRRPRIRHISADPRLTGG